MDLEKLILDSANAQAKTYKTFFDDEDVRALDKKHCQGIDEQEEKYRARESFNVDEGEE